ncbi:MAG: hypothetical protein RIC15_05775 [Vicingaceae bacterium]
MKVNHLIFIVLLLYSLDGIAQKKYKLKGGTYNSGKERYRSNPGTLKRYKTDVFPLDREYRLSGWFASIGGTYMYPIKKGEGSDVTSTSFSDTIRSINTTTNARFEEKPKGRIGLIYADIGYWRAFNNPGFFHFWEVGASYRVYKGSADFSGSSTTTQRVDSSGVVVSNTSSQDYQFGNSYSDQAVSLVLKITRHRHFSSHGFMQHSFGLNADYFLSSSPEIPAVPPGFENIYEPSYHSQIQAQLSYRFGIGWRVAPTVLVIPSIELPLITAYDFENGKSSLPYWSTRQYPIIFSVRVMLLRRLRQECRTPTYKGPNDFQ